MSGGARSGGGRGMSGDAMNGNGAAAGDAGAKQRGTFAVKTGLAQMLKGGVIMDVVNPEQARIAEEAGAVAVMALERVPADIRKDGGIARMSDPEMIRGIKAAVTIPVMAKARIGHFVEAVEHKTTKKQDDEEALTTAKDDLESAKKELMAAMKYFDKLKPSCVDSGVSYEERVKQRKEEIESLQEALKILSGDAMA